MFKIIGADGKEYGPVTAEQIRQWITEGRANANTRVRPDGTEDWKALIEFAEFAAAVAPPPPSAFTGTAEAAATPLPDDLLRRDYHLGIGHCLSRGFDLLKNNFGLVFGGTAIFLGIQILIGILGFIPLLGSLISLANFVIYGPLLGGLYFFLLKVIRSEPAEMGDVFSGFKRNLAQLILAYIVILILTMIACVPGAGLLAAGIIPQVIQQEFLPLFSVLAAAGLVLLVAAVCYVKTIWLFTLALIIDKRMDFWPAMETSRRVVSKHWWKNFGLVLVIGLLNLAGSLVCCVGIFFTVPVTLAAMMCAYEDLFSGPTAQSA